MKLKATLESIDDLDDSLKGLYEERDGAFHLQVEGLEDTGALKRAKDHEKQARKDAEDKARAVAQELADLKAEQANNAQEAAKGKGDVEALDKSWQEKYDKLANDSKAQAESLQGSLGKLLVDNKAIAMAAELAVEGSAEILLPHIKNRLSIDTRDGEFVTVVKGADGKPSALSLDELKQEIAGTEAFAPVIVGSKASGSGASGSGNTGGGASKIDWSQASTAEKVAAIKAKG